MSSLIKSTTPTSAHSVNGRKHSKPRQSNAILGLPAISVATGEPHRAILHVLPQFGGGSNLRQGAWSRVRIYNVWFQGTLQTKCPSWTWQLILTGAKLSLRFLIGLESSTRLTLSGILS